MLEKGVFREDITASLMQKAYATSGLMRGHQGGGNLSNTLQTFATPIPLEHGVTVSSIMLGLLPQI